MSTNGNNHTSEIPENKQAGAGAPGQGNWIKRMISAVSSTVIKKETMVHPCVIDGRKALVYERGLAERDQEALRYLKNFARANDLFLKEDQRCSVKRVKRDRRAQFMPMMVLGASLLTGNAVSASPKLPFGGAYNQVEPQQLQSQTYEVEQQQTQEDKLVADLLHWVNENTSFSFTGDQMPRVMRVSGNEMIEVAFGKQLSRAIDQKNLRIYGLYNFEKKAVYLLNSVDLDTEEGQAILLHELVHFLQYHDGVNKEVKCKNELERLAYTLEARYLYDRGEKASFSRKHIDRVSRCR